MGEGTHYYYFIVDGVVRFAPDQPSASPKSEKIVNYLQIDKHSIKLAEAQKKGQVKTIGECMADEDTCLQRDRLLRMKIGVGIDQFDPSVRQDSLREKCNISEYFEAYGDKNC